MIKDVDYPKPMFDADRWMVRIKPDGTKESKQPQSIHEQKPEDYEGSKWYRTRWSHWSQWASFDDAVEYALTNEKVTHLCFVVRDITPGIAKRFIVFDFDHCIADDGTVDPEVLKILERLNTWVEVSKNGKGLHAVAQYTGPPIKTQTRIKVGECSLDVITSGQIVSTGQVFDGHRDFNDDLDLDALSDFYTKKVRTTKGEVSGDCWETKHELNVGDPLIAQLAREMEEWPICCRSKLGSILGEGGDTEFYKAALHLARFGITGEIARDLLKLIRVDPIDFTDTEIAHKIECAFEETVSGGEFAMYNARAQFDAVEEIEIEETTIVIRHGYEGNSILQHFATFSPETRPKYIIDEVMFEQGALMIGGQQKSFKTSIGLDLLVSLATLKPFLNSFPVECDPKSIAIFSAETTEWMMTDYLSTILASKGLKPEDIKTPFTINSNVPNFKMDRSGEMKRNKPFEKYMDKHKPDIVFLDPLYRMFGGVNQADISQMGQALEYVELICKEADAMPIFCHHSRKPNTANGVEFPQMTLNDLSGAGGGAFARQWLLLSHTCEYAQGAARLHCNVGASGGLSRNWIIHLETSEGGRRVWKTTAKVRTTLEDIIHHLTRYGSQTVKQTSKALRTTEAEVKHSADLLDSKNVIDYNGDTLTLLNPNLKGEVDY